METDRHHQRSAASKPRGARRVTWRWQRSAGKRLLLGVLLFCLAAGVACKSKPREPVIHQGVGVIEEIDESASQVQINHEEIKGYMPAMSMPYRVKDKALLASIKTGDKVEFTMEDGAAGIFIIDLKKKEK